MSTTRPVAALLRTLASCGPIICALLALPIPRAVATADTLYAHTPLNFGRFEAVSAYDTRRHRIEPRDQSVAKARLHLGHQLGLLGGEPCEELDLAGSAGHAALPCRAGTASPRCAR